MRSLPLFHRLRGRAVLLAGEGEAADAKRRLIEEAGGVVQFLPQWGRGTAEGGGGGSALDAGGDRAVRATPLRPFGAPPPAGEDSAKLAFVAIENPADAECIAADLKAAGLLVNVVDRPELCDFTVPAIVDRSPVIVAVGTGGASASLSKALKERLERWLPAGLGRLADAMLAARARVAARHPTVAARRAFWSAALADGAPLDPLRDVDDPAAAIAAALADAPRSAAGTTIIDLPPSADDLTLRQLRLLAQADLVVHPPGCPADVLALARRDAARLPGDAPPADAAGLVVWLRR